jgi:hypothetical protein
MSTRLPKGIVRSMLAQGTLAAFVGMTLGCGANSPAGPTPTPVTPVPVVRAGVYTVTASTNMVASGGQLTVSWTASIGYDDDWIGLFKKSDSNTAPGWSHSTDGTTSGTLTLNAPTEAGQYEFRYLLEDLSDAARSSLVTVF